jgi:hypothetical protein
VIDPGSCHVRRQSSEGDIGYADLDVEPRRRVALLEELRVEDPPVELRRAFLIRHLHADVFEAAGLDRQLGGLLDAACNSNRCAGSQILEHPAPARGGGLIVEHLVLLSLTC